MTWLLAAPGLTVTSSNGPLKPGPKPLARQVIGLAGGGGRRIVALVGITEAEGEERQGHQHDDYEGECCRQAGVALDQSGPTGPETGGTAPNHPGTGGGQFALRLRLSTFGPMNPRKAGSKVRAASMVKATPMAAATARP